jgi:ATP-binding cassette subfamily B protein
MFLLDWRLAVFSLILLPFFVWLTRRVGDERRRIQSVRQGRLADMSTLVEESLSVSGILLGKTMGRSSELVERFSDAAVVAVPSRREGFGMTCLEAMAYGKPVVASAVGGLLDLVADGETGVLVKPHDTHALRAALTLLLGDRDLRRRLGAAGRERARTNFSWDVVIPATLAAYESARMAA